MSGSAPDDPFLRYRSEQRCKLWRRVKDSHPDGGAGRAKARVGPAHVPRRPRLSHAAVPTHPPGSIQSGQVKRLADSP
jgi:hypothetical protein